MADSTVDVAGRIHDELMPHLFASAAALSNLRRRDDLSPSVAASVEQAAGWIDEARDIARQLLQQLDSVGDANLPGAADDSAPVSNPLRSARQFVESLIVADDGPTLMWHKAELLDDLPWTRANAPAVHAIVVELVRNARRHARAGHVTVTAQVDALKWHVEIIDDGIGMDSASCETASHGLKLMRERASSANVELACDSSPNGTRWTVAGCIAEDV